jgi:predicted transcriptional regulator
MKKATIKVGVMPESQFRQRTLAIARGEYKPRKDEPIIWFASYRALAEALSEKNLELLRVVATRQPASISELAEWLGRKPGNVHRSLQTLANLGLLTLEITAGRAVRPVAQYASVKIEGEVSIASVP